MAYPNPMVYAVLKRFVDDVNDAAGDQAYSDTAVNTLKLIGNQCDNIADIVESAERFMTGEYSEMTFLKAISDSINSITKKVVKHG